jgi:hypothetical protein
MDRNLRPRAPGDFTGQIFRRQAIEKARREEEEKAKKAQETDYSQYLKEAEHIALEEHLSAAIDFEEARSS